MKDQEKLLNRQLENKQKIIDATIKMITKKGVDSINVRSVCKAAEIGTGTFYYYFKNKDELLLSFIMEESFENFALETPLEDFPKRITELYTILVKKYLSFGKDFMRSFYTPSNSALASYMSSVEDQFAPDTIMARCETEIRDAVNKNILRNDVDPHELSADICTLMKGIIFEYSLGVKEFDIYAAMERMLSAQLFYYRTS